MRTTWHPGVLLVCAALAIAANAQTNGPTFPGRLSDGAALAKVARLKQVLGVHEDQAVAAALGIGKSSFSDRRRRGSFPEDKLFALMSKRPELKVDATYVLTGDKAGVTSIERDMHNLLAEFTGKVVTDDGSTDQLVRIAADAIRASADTAAKRKKLYEGIQAYLNGMDDRTLGIVTEMVVRLARDAEVQARNKPSKP